MNYLFEFTLRTHKTCSHSASQFTAPSPVHKIFNITHSGITIYLSEIYCVIILYHTQELQSTSLRFLYSSSLKRLNRS